MCRAEQLRTRPDADTWSVLEYAVHAREVLELLSMTLPIVLEHPDSHFPPIDVTEATATRPGVGARSRARAHRASRARATRWWPGPTRRRWRRGTARSPSATTAHAASWIVSHAAHEGAHHLRDIERVEALA